ncbi:MAG: CpaD family pilus assembly lipoprotein [Sphingorhabdus sp.]
MKAKIIATAALAFCLAGCGSMGSNTSMYSTNQPVVQRTNYAIDINLDGYDGVSMIERQRVSEWFEALQLGFGDRIAVDYGDGSANAITEQQVTDLAVEHGMVVVKTAPVTSGLIAPGTARIVVSRSTASVPNCPNWEKPNDANFNSSNHPNYGCAVNSNMAAMVADPEDLVRGRKSRINKDLGAGIPPKITGGN